MSCEGCCSIRKIYGKEECAYTMKGVKSLNKCPCRICLVKVTCKILCEDFKIIVDSYNNLTRRNYLKIRVGHPKFGELINTTKRR